MVTRQNRGNNAQQADGGNALAAIMAGLFFVAWVGEWSLELDNILYNGLWRSPFAVFGFLFEPLPGIRLFLWQVLLIVLAPICLARSGAFSHARELDRAIVVSAICVAITFLLGLAAGGSAYYAYYQFWRWIMALLIAFVLMSSMSSPRHLATLAKAVVFAALIRASLCIYFFWFHIRGNGYQLEYLTNHDDSLLFVTATLILGCWVLHKGGRAAWNAAMFVCPVVFYALLLNDRRIAWVELLLAMAALYTLIGDGPLRRRINKWALILAPLLLVYVAVGWGREGAIFEPIRALTTTGSNSDPSSLARQEEIRNLLYTLTDFGNPIFGTGWGNPYQKLSAIYSDFGSNWALANYTPHNSLLGMIVFTGLFGILGIWRVVPVAAFLAARGYKKSADPITRTAAMVAIGVLVAYSVHCYGDIGFNSFPGNVLLGVALAVAGKVSVLSEMAAVDAAAPAPAGDKSSKQRAVPARSGNAGVARPEPAPIRREPQPVAKGAFVRPGPMPMRRLPRR